MSENYPFSENLREQLADDLLNASGGGDPLTFLRLRIFRQFPKHADYIPTILGRAPIYFFRDVVQYCEMAAWAEDPALIIELLEFLAFLNPVYQQNIVSLKSEGPFRCHPPRVPQYVCRVASELPLFGRPALRTAATGFDINGKDAKRVLLTNGGSGSGKTYTASFFRYLAAIQPMKVGVLTINFAVEDILVQAENLNIPAELLLARNLESQARERSSILKRKNPPPFPGLSPVTTQSPQPFDFQPLENEQQRARWAKSLAKDLVTKALEWLNPKPSWWVLIFDNCEKAPKDLEQFIQSLLEITAGVDTQTAAEADRGCVRIVLLGENTELVPPVLFSNHCVKEDLSQHKIERQQIRDYFVLLGYSRNLQMSDSILDTMTDECLAKTEQEINSQDLAAESRLNILSKIVIEKTLELEKIAAERRG